jgi:ABC-type sugar transport system permease subunit
VSRSRRALGAGFGALLAGGIVAVAAAALYMRTHDEGQLAAARAPARGYARLLAREAERVGQSDPDALRPLVEKLAREGEAVKLVAVVAEPRSTKYRFLRKRRYLAHSDPARARQVLDRRRAGDKQIYDLANLVRRQGRQVETSAAPGEPARVRAAEPIQRAGRHFATALVVTEPRPLTSPPAAAPIGIGLGILVLLGAVCGALTRLRYAAIAAGLAAGGWAATLLLERLRHYFDHAAGAWVADGAGLGVTPALAREVAVDAGPTPRWPLILAVALGLAVALLGQLGIGARLGRVLRDHRSAYAYVVPAALGMLILVFVPFGYGLGLGFFNHAHGSYTFVGLDNFAEILSGGGRSLTHPLNFYFTLGVTVLWTATNVLLHVVIGLCLALVLKNPLLGFKGVYRVLLILPWAVPNYITALIWKGMFHHQYGAVNHVLGMLGIEQVSWFSSFSTAFCANVVTNTWLGFPFMMVVCLGALQSIPADVYEAADVDGATRWQSFWHITLPLLRPALFPAVVIGSIWTFNMFNIIYLVSAGAPGGSSDILITEAYRWAFERADRYGLAAAYALIILVILLAYTLLTNRISRATEDAYQ